MQKFSLLEEIRKIDDDRHSRTSTSTTSSVQEMCRKTAAKVPRIELPILDEEEQQYEEADTVDYDCLPLPSTSTTDY